MTKSQVAGYFWAARGRQESGKKKAPEHVRPGAVRLAALSRSLAVGRYALLVQFVQLCRDAHEGGVDLNE